MKKHSWVLNVVVIFTAVHLFLNIWMWGVLHVFPTATLPGLSNLYKGVAMETNTWLEPWQRWDTPQYQAVTERGYTAFDTALFTPPLYPLMMKWTAPFFKGNTLASGLFVSGIGFLTRLGSPQPLVSMERYVIEIFPAFLVLAAWGRKPAINRLILYLSWLGLLFFSAQFAIWGWVG